MKFGKQRTVSGSYSEENFGDSGPDQTRNVDIGPESMDQVKNLSEKWLEANSDFSRKLVPTAGVVQNNRQDVIEARSGPDIPRGQRKPFKWS